MMFQCPAVGTGSFFMYTSITTGLLSRIAFTIAGFSWSADSILIPSMP